jgi:hypothetical protein
MRLEFEIPSNLSIDNFVLDWSQPVGRAVRGDFNRDGILNFTDLHALSLDVAANDFAVPFDLGYESKTTSPLTTLAYGGLRRAR